MKSLLLAFSVLALAGCAHALGYAGMHPGRIECKGKGSITVTGQTSLTAGYGGAGQNSGTVQADCGDGLILEQGPPVSTK